MYWRDVGMFSCILNVAQKEPEKITLDVNGEGCRCEWDLSKSPHQAVARRLDSGEWGGMGTNLCHYYLLE